MKTRTVRGHMPNVLALFTLLVLALHGVHCSDFIRSNTDHARVCSDYDEGLIPAARDAPFWMENVKHQGKAPFNPDPSGYKVFRNVKVCITSENLNSDWKGQSLIRISVLWAMGFTTIPRPSSKADQEH